MIGATPGMDASAPVPIPGAGARRIVKRLRRSLDNDGMVLDD